ncbi:hypothetical protein LQW54_007918 [Pestalotiopsis sp. IQ-011]
MPGEFVNGIPRLRGNKRQNEEGYGFEDPGDCHCHCVRLAALSVNDYEHQLRTAGVQDPLGPMRHRLVTTCQAIIHNIHKNRAFQTWRPSRAILQTRDDEVGFAEFMRFLKQDLGQLDFAFLPTGLFWDFQYWDINNVVRSAHSRFERFRHGQFRLRDLEQRIGWPFTLELRLSWNEPDQDDA